MAAGRPGVAVAVAGCLTAVVAGLALFGPVGDEGAVRYSKLPVVELPLAPVQPMPVAEEPPPGPRLTLLLSELGLSSDGAGNALQMDAALGLVISAYADDPAAWAARARAAGHEAYLEAPLIAVDPAVVDRGPMALAPGQPDEDRRTRLRWLLQRASGFAGVAAAGGAFDTGPDAARPIVAAAADAGLIWIELGGDGMRAAAAGSRARFVATGPALDAPASARAIDLALDRLEAAARRGEPAAGWGRARPGTLTRLRTWIDTLDDKGIALVAPSVLATVVQAPVR